MFTFCWGTPSPLFIHRSACTLLLSLSLFFFLFFYSSSLLACIFTLSLPLSACFFTLSPPVFTLPSSISSGALGDSGSRRVFFPPSSRNVKKPYRKPRSGSNSDRYRPSSETESCCRWGGAKEGHLSPFLLLGDLLNGHSSTVSTMMGRLDAVETRSVKTDVDLWPGMHPGAPVSV